MSSNAVVSVGAKFYRWNGSEWVKISEVISINGPNKTRETIDVTNLDSTGGYREFKGSFRDGGTVALNMNYTREAYEIFNDDFDDDDSQNYKIVIPDAVETTLEYEAWVTEEPLTIEVGDRVMTNVTMKVTGQPDLYDGSSGGP